VAQVQRQREEEAAPEESRAFSRYSPAEDSGMPPYLIGLVLIAALAGAGARGGARPGRRPALARAVSDPDHERGGPKW